MYDFWYDYVKPSYCKNEKFRNTDTDRFIVYIKGVDIYGDIADVETRFDTSNYKLECNFIERPLPKEKNKKVFGLMKDELGGKIMTKFVRPRAKTYSYLIDDVNEDKSYEKNVS